MIKQNKINKHNRPIPPPTAIAIFGIQINEYINSVKYDLQCKNGNERELIELLMLYGSKLDDINIIHMCGNKNINIHILKQINIIRTDIKRRLLFLMINELSKIGKYDEIDYIVLYHNIDNTI